MSAAPDRPPLRLVGDDFDGSEEDEEAFSSDIDEPGWASHIEEGTSGDNALELLVDLVRVGSVDPWDLDLKVVADRYLEAIENLAPEDLPRSGRLLFFASVIVRIKAQLLAGQGADLLAEPVEDEAWDEGGEDWDEWGDEDDEAADLLTRRSRRGPGEILLFPRNPMAKRRPVTIQDLIEALEKAEAHEKKMERARARQPKKNVLPFKNAKEALATAHQDDFERDVSLAQRLLELAWASDEPPGLEVFAGEMDQVSAFLSVLFLAAKGKVSVDQEEFYGKVVIRQGDPSVLQDAAGPRERFVPKKREKKKKAPEGEEGAAADAEGAADGEGAAVAEGGAGDPVVEGGVAPEAAEARAGREAAPTPLPTAVHQQTMFEIPASADADAEKEET